MWEDIGWVHSSTLCTVFTDLLNLRKEVVRLLSTYRVPRAILHTFDTEFSPSHCDLQAGPTARPAGTDTGS